MKLSLYSNKLDIIYKQINSDKIQTDKFLLMKNNLSTINSIYDKANTFIEIQNNKNSNGKLVEEEDDKEKKFNLKIKHKNKTNDPSLTFFEKPKKIFMKNKKINLDELTKKIGERYNIKFQAENKKIIDNHNHSEAENDEFHAKSEEKTKRFLNNKVFNNNRKATNSSSKNKLENFFKGTKLKDVKCSDNNYTYLNTNREKSFSIKDKFSSRIKNATQAKEELVEKSRNPVYSNEINQIEENSKILRKLEISSNIPNSSEKNMEKILSFNRKKKLNTNKELSQEVNSSTQKNLKYIKKKDLIKSRKNSLLSPIKCKVYSANVSPDRDKFSVGSKNLDESNCSKNKAKKYKKEKRNSVLFDIMRSVRIDKNLNRKYLTTAKNDVKREKNKFKIYDSSDESDSEIFGKNLTPKFNRKKLSTKLKENFPLSKRLSLPIKDIDLQEMILNLQNFDLTNSNRKLDLISNFENNKKNFDSGKKNINDLSNEKIEENDLDNINKNLFDNALNNIKVKTKNSKKSFQNSPKKKGSDTEKQIKRMQIKKTLLGKQLLLKGNISTNLNNINSLNPSLTNINNNGNNTYQMGKNSNNSIKNCNTFIDSNLLMDNPYGFSTTDSKFLNTNNYNTSLNSLKNNNLGISKKDSNNLIINSYNFINKSQKNQNLNIFNNDSVYCNNNCKMSNFTSFHNKTNSNYLNTNNEINYGNTINISGFTNNNNLTKQNNINLGTSHFSQPYYINIINENEISEIESSKNNSISQIKEKDSKKDSNSILNQVYSDQNDNNQIKSNKFLKNNNLISPNNKEISGNLTSKNRILSEFESLENVNKVNSHSRNIVKKIHNIMLSKDSENNRSNAYINDESTNFCNINSKGSNFNTLDSGKNLQIQKKSSIKTTSRNKTNYNNVSGNNTKHYKSLSKGVLYNNNKKPNKNHFEKVDINSNINYGVFFKDFEDNIKKDIKNLSESETKRFNKENHSSSIGKNKKEINIQLDLSKINEEIKERKVPKFKNQFKLNKYLIRDFKIGELSNAKESSKNKLKISEEFINYQNSKRDKYSKYKNSILNESNNNGILSDDNENLQRKKDEDDLLKYKNNIFEYKIKSQIYELEREKRDLDKQIKERIESKSKKITEKILELNNYSYEDMNNEEETNNLKRISHRNLEKVMRLRRILKNQANEEVDFFLVSHEPKLKEIKNETEDNFTLAMHKLGPPAFLKTKFKNETIKTYKIVSGKFFGC